jgi:hypothetical protein
MGKQTFGKRNRCSVDSVLDAMALLILEDSWLISRSFGSEAVVVGQALYETTDGMKVSLKECGKQ